MSRGSNEKICVSIVSNSYTQLNCSFRLSKMRQDEITDGLGNGMGDGLDGGENACGGSGSMCAHSGVVGRHSVGGISYPGCPHAPVKSAKRGGQGDKSSFLSPLRASVVEIIIFHNPPIPSEFDAAEKSDVILCDDDLGNFIFDQLVRI